MTGQNSFGTPRTPHAADDLPALTPAQERALIDRWLAGDVEARQELERYHRPWVERRALHYRWCGMPDVELILCAWNGFWEAAPRFDPTHGVSLKSFAWPRVDGHLKEEARRYEGVHNNAWRVYKSVQSALEGLTLTAAEATYPRARARLLAQLVQVPTIANLLACDKPWSWKRLEEAVDESLLYLRHGVQPLVEEDADEEQPGASVSLDRLALPVEQTDQTPSDEERAELMLRLYERACETLPTGLAARQFMALALLHKIGELTWAKIGLLLKSEPGHPAYTAAEVEWEMLRGEVCLPDALPRRWAEVRALFAAAPPTLKADALKQWYKTQNGLVVAGKVRPERRTAQRPRGGRKRAA